MRLRNKLGVEQQKVQGKVYVMMESENKTKKEISLAVVEGHISITENYGHVLFDYRSTHSFVSLICTVKLGLKPSW